ncbi:MAG: His/Gly/Thr/Pro-type tRNA ligase C-terminal domain-containing protein, partial [Geodermatophilaceae bacterium]
ESSALFLTADGVRRPVIMGSYGIGLGRALACVVEAHHDERGIAWPAEVAPYRAHLVAIGAARNADVAAAADGLYERLGAAGVAVLYDDRGLSPGVALADADLLGMPTILTVSPRSLAAGGVETTDRATGERAVRPFADVEAALLG